MTKNMDEIDNTLHGIFIIFIISCRRGRECDTIEVRIMSCTH